MTYTIRNRRDIENLELRMDDIENRVEDLRDLMRQTASLMNACYTLNVNYPELALNDFIQSRAAEIEQLVEVRQVMLDEIVLAEAMFDDLDGGYRQYGSV